MARNEVIPPSNTLHSKVVSLDCGSGICRQLLGTWASDKYKLRIPPERRAEGVVQVESFPESSSEGLGP